MLRKITVILIWVFIIGYLLVSFSFVSEKKDAITLNDIKVKIKDSIDSGFVSNKNVEKIVKVQYPDWKGTRFIQLIRKYWKKGSIRFHM